LKVRSAERVAALFQLIRASAVQCLADVQRGGAGVPTVRPLLGLSMSAPSQTIQQPQTRAAEGIDAYRDGAMIGSIGGGAASRIGAGSAAAGYPAGQTGYPVTPWQQVPAGTPLTQNAMAAAWALSNPAALQLITRMRAAGLL